MLLPPPPPPWPLRFAYPPASSAPEKKLALDGEVGAPRADITALLEEKRLALEGQLRRLNDRSDDLSDALRGLRCMEFFRKGRVSEVLE